MLGLQSGGHSSAAAAASMTPKPVANVLFLVLTLTALEGARAYEERKGDAAN